MSELSARIAELLIRLKDGDSAALDEILRLIGGRMMSLALGVVKNRADAEDVVQTAFVKTVQNVDKFHGGNGYGFIMKITQNAALDHLRRRGRKAEINIDDCFSLSSSDGYDEERVAAALTLEQGIARLPAYGKKLIYYRYYMDMTLREIAKATGKSKSQIQRDLEETEKSLKKYLT
ncbi:MAG: hypothetical protein DBX59_04715 [Bacillota bacterium]|nr:MAG: hypothetical protein DBX59_04715 [Bacillota bacterium]